jgi:hypothetical protein
MSKTKKNKTIQYAVQYLFDIKKQDIKNIALELKISENEVEGIINKNNLDNTKNKKTVSKSQSLMIRHTSNKKTNNVSIMTEAASQLNDELKKKINNNSSRNTQKSIFRPNK